MKTRICSVISPISLLVVIVAVNSQTLDEFLEELRDKIRNLEATKQITRDYEPYIQKDFEDNEKYDFIIVGSGSAGSVLINRLSEISDWKILVLEAGGEPDILTDIPYWSLATQTSYLDWGFFTEKEDNFALGLEDQRMHWIRGKGLGGTSLINSMIVTRGAKSDYDNWANLGNPGWAHEDVLPYFKKMETCKVKIQDFDLRGHDGPICVEDIYVSEAGGVFIEAANYSGYKYVDYNGKDHLGVSYFQTNHKKGLRCSGERCYIKPIKNRENLTIRLNSHVTKIIFDGKTAKGVEYSKNGQIYRALAAKEVILSAGVFNSPHILLLSGIGPKEQLEKFGIETIVDLPVGKKIYDHPTYWGLGFTLNQSLHIDGKLFLEDGAFKDLYNDGGGILTNIGSGDALIFLKTPFAKNNTADIELIFFSEHYSENPDRGNAQTIRVTRNIYDRIYKKYKGKNAITLVVDLLHPRSFGHLELQSDDPFVHPKLFGGYFTNPNDVKVLTAGIREAIKIMLSPPFEKYGVKVMDDHMPGCEDYQYDSDEYWECALRTLTTTIYHQISSCKMGPVNDPEAVVDAKLKVHGVDKLRVIDTSVIPVTITGHTNIPAFLVGEKGADIIKDDHVSLWIQLKEFLRKFG